MAFSLGRAAGAALRRTAKPLALSASASGHSGAGLRTTATPVAVSASGLFGKLCYRQSLRISDVPMQKIANSFEGWNADELVCARNIIDSKLAEKGLAVISTGKEARNEVFVRNTSKTLAQLKTEMSFIKNKKGDLTSVNFGKLGSVNVLSVLTLLLKVEEIWPMIPVIRAWIEAFQG